MESFKNKKKLQFQDTTHKHTVEEIDHERSNKAVLWIMICSLLIVIAMIVGAVVGTKNNRNSSDDGDDDETIDILSPTISPTRSTTTLPPLQDSQKELLEYLSQYSPTLQDIIDDSNNNMDESTILELPQYQAFLWLLDGTYDTIYNFQSDDVDKYIVLSSFALATLYYGTLGDRWIPEAQINWLQYDVPVCDWVGINCTTVTNGGSVRNIHTKTRFEITW